VRLLPPKNIILLPKLIAECPVLGAGKIPLVSSDFHLRSLKFKE